MAALDSSIPFKNATGVLTIAGGGVGQSITCTFVQGTMTSTETGRTYVEARSRGRRDATPVVIETDDGTVTGQFSCLVTSFQGSSNVHPYEACTHTGTAVSWTSTGLGGKKLLSLAFTWSTTEDGGGSQTRTYAYSAIDSIELDSGGSDGLFMMTVSFTHLGNRPTTA